MKAIERIAQHFTTQETKIIEVPEWADNEGKPMVLHVDPMTLGEKSRLYKMAKDDDMTLLAYVVIIKAKDEQGNKLFNLADKKALMEKCDPEVLARVARTILNSTTIEEQLGN